MDGPAAAVERVARQSYGKLVAMLTRRTRDIAAAEDALSGALVKALEDWPRSGVPANPEGWLVAAAPAAGADAWRRGETARAGREMIAMLDAERAPVPDEGARAPEDARLALMFACAHRRIDPAIHAPLMLQAVLGLDAARHRGLPAGETAHARPAVARAKARLKEAGARFGPAGRGRPARAPPATRFWPRSTHLHARLGWRLRRRRPYCRLERRGRLAGTAVAASAIHGRDGQRARSRCSPLMLFQRGAAAWARRADGLFVPLSEQDVSL